MCPGAAAEAAERPARLARRAPVAGSAAIVMDSRDLRMCWEQATADSAGEAIRAAVADQRIIRGEAGGLPLVHDAAGAARCCMADAIGQ
eukprot:12878051-Alexandrium_andersonii.AAC.1